MTFAVKLCSVRLTGTLGYLVCVMLLTHGLLWCSIVGSNINLMSVTIERYIKVVHSRRSKKLLRKWMRCSAAAFAWIAGVVCVMALVVSTSTVIDGVCYGYAIWTSETLALVHGVWYFVWRLELRMASGTSCRSSSW